MVMPQVKGKEKGKGWPTHMIKKQKFFELATAPSTRTATFGAYAALLEGAQ
jgi:hypothetical protein